MKLKRDISSSSSSMNTSAMDSTTSTKSVATTTATAIFNNMSSFSFPLSPASRRNHQYSIERLRVVYIDLLQHIDVAKEKDLGRCGIDDADEDFHKKSTRFSFRRKLLPHCRQGSIKSINSNSNNNQSSSSESTSTASTSISSSAATTTFETTTATTTTTTTTANESRQEDEVWNGDENYYGSNRELVAAFRLLAATKSPDKEGDNFGAAPFRDDASVIAWSTAKAIEERVVELIRTIGEIIVHGSDDQDPKSPSSSGAAQQSSNKQHVAVRGDSVFEYFCEKNILSLLVDIAKEVRQGNEVRCSDSLFHGVVWSPKVKGQVFQTASLLLSDTIRSASHHSSLYYLLSQNHINHLIKCMIPLKQWTDQALVHMMPSYVDLLRTVTVQLANDPCLFPFLTIDIDTETNNQEATTTGVDATSGGESLPTNTTTIFPLFTASIEVATSNFAESDSFIYGTSLAAIVNIMQISSPPIQDFVANASVELRKLSDHLCQRLLDRFYKIASLTTGPIVDGVRSNAISGQLAGLRDQLGMMRELFYSGVRGLDVRLCETLLQRVVNVLLKCLLPGTTNRPFLAAVGEIDIDVIPDSEAMAQVATIFLAQMLTNLAYKPMQRMLAVALFHPKSTSLWSTTQSTKPRSSSPNEEENETYIFMPALSDIVNGDENKSNIESSTAKTIPNPYREEVFRSLGGEYGEWRVLTSSCLVQSLLMSENRDYESLHVLNVIPKFTDALDYKATSLENAIATYLQREHRPSRVSSRSLESIGHLSLQLIQQIVASNSLGDSTTKDGVNMPNVKERLSNTVLWKAMQTCLGIFRDKALNSLKEGTGISNIFLDLVEAEITRRYTAHFTTKRTTTPASTSEATTTTYICSLKSRDSVNDAEMLVRKCRDVSSNEVETARFFIREMLQYRALNKVLDCYCLDIEEKACASATINGIAGGSHHSNSSRKSKPTELKLTDKADSLIRMIGGLKDNPLEGSDLDLTGRMTFACRSAPCSPSKGGFSQTEKNGRRESGTGNKRAIALGFRNNNPRLMLVLDPTNMNVVKPAVGQMEDNRGTILCSISLRSVIGAAADNEWLHVAVRHGDVTSLIKNGNMALKFENAGTCLVVKQYLDRSREVLRQELLEKVSTLLDESSSKKESPAAAATDDNENIVDIVPAIDTDGTSSVQC